MIVNSAIIFCTYFSGRGWGSTKVYTGRLCPEVRALKAGLHVRRKHKHKKPTCKPGRRKHRRKHKRKHKKRKSFIFLVLALMFSSLGRPCNTSTSTRGEQATTSPYHWIIIYSASAILDLKFWRQKFNSLRLRMWPSAFAYRTCKPAFTLERHFWKENGAPFTYVQ